mmetsp:Transcript_40594/g.126995  ORF Transcript_40594/g.126995 Transcript_40594/m.126995 type:complete len:218 (+) Transcript_40594:835-1488(+)
MYNRIVFLSPLRAGGLQGPRQLAGEDPWSAPAKQCRDLRCTLGVGVVPREGVARRTFIPERRAVASVGIHAEGPSCGTLLAGSRSLKVETCERRRRLRDEVECRLRYAQRRRVLRRKTRALKSVTHNGKPVGKTPTRLAKARHGEEQILERVARVLLEQRTVAHLWMSPPAMGLRCQPIAQSLARRRCRWPRLPPAEHEQRLWVRRSLLHTALDVPQ